MKIAIHKNDDIFKHSTTWNNEWVNFCKLSNIEYEIVNCYDKDFLSNITNYDVLLWHFSNYSLQDMLFARTILYSVAKLGIKIFPDYNTSWHFDDKIAETYLLQTIEAPLPKSWIFYTYHNVKQFLDVECSYPIVAKLRCGSGSSNVKLLKNKKEAISYAKKMFANGFNPSPKILFKTMSNIKSSKDWNTFLKRFKRIPDFWESIRRAKYLPNEKGYVYFQEFIPNDGYDLKVVVVGDKLSFLARDVRKGDFRASGGGSIKYDFNLLTEDIRNISFDISEKLGFQSMGYDFVIDKRDNIAKIVEISYGFSHTAQMGLGGYWDRKGLWHTEPLNAPVEVLKNILKIQ